MQKKAGMSYKEDTFKTHSAGNSNRHVNFINSYEYYSRGNISKIHS